MPNRSDTGLPFAGLQSPLPKPTYIVQSQAEIGEADKKLELPPSSFLFFISGFVCLFFSPKHSSISMAAIAAAVVFSPEKITHRMISSASLCSFSLSPKPLSNSRLSITKSHLQALPFQKVTPVAAAAFLLGSSPTTAESGIFQLGKKKDGVLLETQIQKQLQRPPIREFLLWAFFFWVSTVFFYLIVTCGVAVAAVAADSIRASSFGLKVATALQGSGWTDEAIVFALATLPVLELRGAIPVGYWMRLDPLRLTLLSVLGNMVPVPFILLYLKRFATFIAGRNASMSCFMDLLFERAKEKAAPVQEFQWLGLMLFVAVPFPGTGAWTGAIVASILNMPFWSAVSANFFGVVFAGLLVNLLVNLGLKYAVAIGLILFIISTVMWSVLRFVKKSLGSN
eukprot:TRINITY_DN12242_c1_g3_i1.p1 TRINITY_DN12242_c1_g3~~TRINITY_DN12242_c1_g3_i1.p1  ORF type:complete len:397 (+),score=76.54 TRINITY_DN12242_c1_g3_i1:116-1306(+)